MELYWNKTIEQLCAEFGIYPDEAKLLGFKASENGTRLSLNTPENVEARGIFVFEFAHEKAIERLIQLNGGNIYDEQDESKLQDCLSSDYYTCYNIYYNLIRNIING